MRLEFFIRGIKIKVLNSHTLCKNTVRIQFVPLSSKILVRTLTLISNSNPFDSQLKNLKQVLNNNVFLCFV